MRDPNLVARKSVVPPAPRRISTGDVSLFLSLASLVTLMLAAQTPRPNTLTPQKAAELLRLRDAVLAKQACSPFARNSVVARSPSPTDEDLFDDAIAGLADFEMDGEQVDNTDDSATTSRMSPPSDGETQGKRRRTASDSDNDDDNDGQVRKAVKIHESRGRPKAADYEPSVRTIFSIAWALYRGRLCTEGAMPDRMQEVTWAKLAWNEACKRLHSRVAYDAEIIKMVRSFAYSRFLCLPHCIDHIARLSLSWRGQE